MKKRIQGIGQDYLLFHSASQEEEQKIALPTYCHEGNWEIRKESMRNLQSCFRALDDPLAWSRLDLRMLRANKLW